MSNTILKIKGMHCQGCVSLITLSLIDDAGLESHIVRISLLETEGQLGEIELADVTEKQVNKAVEVINTLGPYKVLAEKKAAT